MVSVKRIREDYSCPTDIQARFPCLALPLQLVETAAAAILTRFKKADHIQPPLLRLSLPLHFRPRTAQFQVFYQYFWVQSFILLALTTPRFKNGLPVALGQAGNINEIIEPFPLHLHLLNLIYSSIQLTFYFSGQAVVLMRATNSKAKQPASSY